MNGMDSGGRKEARIGVGRRDTGSDYSDSEYNLSPYPTEYGKDAVVCISRVQAPWFVPCSHTLAIFAALLTLMNN